MQAATSVGSATKSPLASLAIITGSASGIGAATVLALARLGYDTVGIDIHLAGALATARSACELQGKHHALRADVADEAALVAAMASASQWLGGLSALVTCAGAAMTTPFMQLSAEDFRRVHDVNVIGTFVAIREAAKVMSAGSRICTVASVAGLRGGGLMGTAAYASSKGAVLALSKNAARSLASQGIIVNCIAPGATLTPMIEAAWQNPERRSMVESLVLQNRTAGADEIAASIAYLLSPQASYVNGATLVADGGLALY
jgi:NAD(P)-dependent dehydrogenase (short-subunit alcohol dehydrogenase family)